MANTVYKYIPMFYLENKYFLIYKHVLLYFLRPIYVGALALYIYL